MIYDLQKASMWKRISAGMFDGILLGIAAVLFAWLLSVALGFDVHYDVLTDGYARYGEEYGVNFDLSLTEYEGLSEDESQRLSDAYAALAADDEVLYAYNMLIQLTLLITSLGVLLAYAALEFTLPLILGNGQTIGKRIFGLGVMRSDDVRISPVFLFIRTFLGKYAIETMVPLLILVMLYFGSIGMAGTLVLGLLLLLEIVLMLATRTNSPIHDCLASTVCIDFASQMIFKTREDMIEYKKRRHAEQAARQEA